MSELTKNIMRELMQINRKSVFDDNATIEAEEDNCTILNVTLTPQQGLFKDTSIPFTLEFTDDYPSCAPVPYCKKVVYHSNISEDGSVCLNMFSEPDPSYRIEQYVNGLLWLLDNQNFDSQLNGYVTPNRRLFQVNFKLACLGYEIGGLRNDDIYAKRPNLAERHRLLREIVGYNGIFPKKKVAKEKKKVRLLKEELKKEVEKVEEKVEKVEEKTEEPKGEEEMPKKEEKEKEEEVPKKEEEKKVEEPEEKEKEPEYPEVPTSKFLSGISKEPAHFDFFCDEAPFLSSVRNDDPFVFLWQKGSSTRATGLARRFNVPLELVMRPVLVQIEKEGKEEKELALILTAGEENIDVISFAALLGFSRVSVPKAAQLKELNPSILDKLPFGWTGSQVYIDEDLLTNQESFILQTEFPNLVIKGKAGDFLKLFERKWSTSQKVRLPRDPPKKEKSVAMAPPSAEEEVKVEEKEEEEKKEEEKIEEKKPEEREEKKEEKKEREREKEKEKERERMGQISCRTASASEETIEALPIVSGLI